MKISKYKRVIAITLVIAGILAGAALAGLHIAGKALKHQVEQALGPASEVQSIELGWSAIEMRGIRIAAPSGWPAADTLRADRILIHPDLLSLFSTRRYVPRITVENAYVSTLRTRDGKFHLLPSLLGKAKPGKPGATADAPSLSIGTVEVRHGVLEFFDASVRRPAHKTRIEQLHARVNDLQLSSLAGRTRIQVDGAIKGVHQDGRLSIDGWAELATGNSEIATKLHGVDLVALQPYLIKASETGVRRGTLDLRLKSTVRNKRLLAPGTLTLSGLELAPGGGPLGTFMGVPRQAVIAGLKNRKGQINVDFTLEGKVDDPQFSLNENLALRLGASIAENLGISIGGIGKGVGGAAQGLEGVMKKLFGK